MPANGSDPQYSENASIISPIFWCKGTPCQAPHYCCGPYLEGCCWHSSEIHYDGFTFPWYAEMLIVLGIVGIAVGIGVYCYYRRRRRYQNL